MKKNVMRNVWAVVETNTDEQTEYVYPICKTFEDALLTAKEAMRETLSVYSTGLLEELEGNLCVGSEGFVWTICETSINF